MNQAKVLENVATFYGDRPAISVGTEVYLTYRQFADRVARLAGALRGPLGLRRRPEPVLLDMRMRTWACPCP